MLSFVRTLSILMFMVALPLSAFAADGDNSNPFKAKSAARSTPANAPGGGKETVQPPPPLPAVIPPPPAAGAAGAAAIPAIPESKLVGKINGTSVFRNADGEYEFGPAKSSLKLKTKSKSKD